MPNLNTDFTNLQSFVKSAADAAALLKGQLPSLPTPPPSGSGRAGANVTNNHFSIPAGLTPAHYAAAIAQEQAWYAKTNP